MIKNLEYLPHPKVFCGVVRNDPQAINDLHKISEIKFDRIIFFEN